jgi:hypothetical protein
MKTTEEAIASKIKGKTGQRMIAFILRHLMNYS